MRISIQLHQTTSLHCGFLHLAEGAITVLRLECTVSLFNSRYPFVLGRFEETKGLLRCGNVVRIFEFIDLLFIVVHLVVLVVELAHIIEVLLKLLRLLFLELFVRIGDIAVPLYL